MSEEKKENTESKEKRAQSEMRYWPILSKVLLDGTIIEAIYSAKDEKTAFVISIDGVWKTEVAHALNAGMRLVPYSPRNDLVREQIVTLAEHPMEYGSKKELFEDIRAYIQRYVVLAPEFEVATCYYVMLSWVHDAFKVLPYLRVRGDLGSGKSTFLDVVQEIAYKSLLLSGGSSSASVFHMLNKVQGTIILDESDFRYSDLRSDIAKILNEGNRKGRRIYRVFATDNSNREPRAKPFNVFGPKIVAMRERFQDHALESRFITGELGLRHVDTNVPRALPDEYKAEGLELRNKLLLFRLRERNRITPILKPLGLGSDRIDQIYSPLVTLVDDPEHKNMLYALAQFQHTDFVQARGMDLEARVLEACFALAKSSKKPNVRIKEIADYIEERHAKDFDRPISPRLIGSILRSKLYIRPYQSVGAYVIRFDDLSKLDGLCAKYGITMPDGIMNRPADA